MKINIIGTGYVGLVTGVCLAAKGHLIKCFDKNNDIIKLLKKGRSHFYEKNLENLLNKNKKNISFELLDLNSEKKLLNCETLIIAVGTLTNNDKIDLSQIKEACKSIGKLLRNHEDYISIIIKSTVVPGTTDTYVKEILEDFSGKKIGQFGLGMNPEFLKEGNAINDFMNPDRIVFGYEDLKTLEYLQKIYKPWKIDKVEVNTRSAEMIKYVNNSLLATQISTINEYSNIANSIGNIDFNTVMNAVHLDNRWNPINKENQRVYPQIIDYLKPGCGFGGSCFPKDVKALSALSKEKGVTPLILDSVIKVNNDQPKAMLSYLQENIGSLKNMRTLVLGLAFKPETDDVRESVSLKIIKHLNDLGATISAHDPISVNNAKKEINLDIKYVKDWKKEIFNNDITIIATNWSEYLHIKKIEKKLSTKTLFDTRSLFNKRDFKYLKYLNIN